METTNETSAYDQIAENQQTNGIFNFVHRDMAGEIPTDIALQLIKNYKLIEGHDNEENPQGRTGKSKCVWLHITELEDICRKVRSTPHGDGVRIYFGKYPNDARFERVPTRQGTENHKNKRTIVLITTVSIDSKTSKDDLTEKEVKAAFAKEYDFEKMAAYNHGELCPNNCVGTIKV